jgi:hypothetical protein
MYYNYWDYWKQYHNVVFDGPNKIIYINDGVTSLDVQVDLYSAWKEWLAKSQWDGLINAKYVQAFRSVGGDPLPGNRFLGDTYFLTNGWRIKPYNGEYRIEIVGNLYTEEGDDAFLDPDSGKVTILQTVSNLVDTVGVTTVESAQSLTDIKETVWESILEDYESVAGTNAADIIQKIKKLASLIPAGV